MFDVISGAPKTVEFKMTDLKKQVKYLEWC